MAKLILLDKDSTRTEIKHKDILAYDNRRSCRGIRILRKDKKGEEYPLRFIEYPAWTDPKPVYRVPFPNDGKNLIYGLAACMTISNQDLFFRSFNHPDYGEAIMFIF